MKKIEDDPDRWKDISCSWIGRINMIKMTVLPKVIYRFSAISIEITMTFFHRIRTNSSKFSIYTQKILNNQNNLEKEKQSWKNHVP